LAALVDARHVPDELDDVVVLQLAHQPDLLLHLHAHHRRRHDHALQHEALTRLHGLDDVHVGKAALGDLALHLQRVWPDAHVLAHERVAHRVARQRAVHVAHRGWRRVHAPSGLRPGAGLRDAASSVVTCAADAAAATRQMRDSETRAPLRS